MTQPFYDDGTVQILHGDAREILPQLPANSVQTCVTSPPYFGLRDYGGGAWVGGDDGCDHLMRQGQRQDGGRGNHNGGMPGFHGGTKPPELSTKTYRDTCGKCGATRQDQQIGLEPTPALYVAALSGVFEQVRRVVTDTCWINLGDSYASATKGSGGATAKQATNSGSFYTPHRITHGVKDKDLIGIPWRVAFALQDAGWWLRSDIIWAKGNPMPESVLDRPTKSHEYLFLLAKAERYYYDQDAIREGWADDRNGSPGGHKPRERNRGGRTDGYTSPPLDWVAPEGRTGRNKRSVWTVNTVGYPGAHFATFPPKLIEPCILAGCPAQTCAACGAPWVRVVERERVPLTAAEQPGRGYVRDIADQKLWSSGTPTHSGLGNTERVVNHTTGWQPTCTHDAGTVPGTVLDLFGGTGTTGVVAKKLGRRAILIEQSLDYCRMAADRIEATPTPFPFEVFS